MNKRNAAKEAAIISLDWLLRLARIARAPESSYAIGKPLLPFIFRWPCGYLLQFHPVILYHIIN